MCKLSDMKNIKYWIFDLDNTLYPHQADLFSQVDKKMGLRSEEHTSELQSRSDLVCRLLLEKKKHNRHLYLTPIT